MGNVVRQYFHYRKVGMRPASAWRLATIMNGLMNATGVLVVIDEEG